MVILRTKRLASHCNSWAVSLLPVRRAARTMHTICCTADYRMGRDTGRSPRPVMARHHVSSPPRSDARATLIVVRDAHLLVPGAITEGHEAVFAELARFAGQLAPQLSERIYSITFDHHGGE